jgi:hypothetical protein
MVFARESNRTLLEAARRQTLKQVLEDRGIAYNERSLFTEYGGFGASIHVFIPAPLPSGEDTRDTLVLGIPLSSLHDQGERFSFAFELGLEFIQKISTARPDLNVLTAFLGDEWTDLDAPYKNPHLGLEDLYAWLETPDPETGQGENFRVSPARTVLLYLDLPAAPAELVLNHGAGGILAPLNITKPLKELCDSRGIPNRFKISFNELFKLHLAEGPSVLEFAHERKLQALYLDGLLDGRPGRTTLDAASLGGMLAAYAGGLGISSENLDYHYLIFQGLGKTVFVSETSTIVYFLAASTLFIFGILVYSMVFRHKLIIRWRLFLKRSWFFLIFYGMLVLSLAGASVFFHLFIPRIAADVQGLSRALPYPVLAGMTAVQLALGTALFSVCSPVLNIFKIHRRETFYAHAAVTLVILGVLMGAVIDITFISIFIWALVFVLLAAFTRSPPLILLCAACSSLHGLSALWVICRIQNPRLPNLILSGNPKMILYMALAVLPVFILIKRAEVLRRNTRAVSRKQLIIPRLVFPGITLIAGAACFIVLPGMAGTGPVRRVIDGKRGEELLGMRVAGRVLLERRILDITLEAPGVPTRFELRLTGDGEEDEVMPVIYSAAMPFRFIADEYSPGQGAAEFLLGDYPDNPFNTEILLPVDFSGSLHVQAVYAEWDETIDPVSPGTDDYILRIIRHYPVGGSP